MPAQRWGDDNYLLRRQGPSGTVTSSPTNTSATGGVSTTSPSSTSTPTSSSSTSSPSSDTSSTAAASSSLSSVEAQSSQSLASIASVSSASARSAETSISTQSTLSVQSTASLASVSGSTTITTSVPASTLIITNGVTITTTIAIPTTSSAAHGSGSSGGSSHTGAIVGGVVGGVVGLALLAILGWFFWRRKKRSEFDGNWDPDRNIQRPTTLGAGNNLDLAAGATGGPTLPQIPIDDDVDTSPRPFSMAGSDPEGSYAPTMATSHFSGNPLLAAGAGAGAGAAAAHYYNQPQQQQMSQHGGAPSIVSSASAYPPSSGPYGNSTSASGGLGAGADGRALRMTKQQEAAHAYAETHPAYSGGSGGSGDDNASLSASGGPMSATSGGGVAVAPRLSVMNPSGEEDEEAPDGAAVGAGEMSERARRAPPSVVQHRDGGRYRPPEPENDVEIPPSYDSIPADER